MRIRIDGKYCVYCGEVADTEEHFPPKSVTNNGYLFPCCRECNSLAGDREPHDFDKRINLVKTALYDRNKGVLKAAPWSDEELEGLQGRLKKYVSDLEKDRRRAQARLSFNPRAYLGSIDL